MNMIAKYLLLNVDSINNVFLGVENRAENDDSDSNDDPESQSIDMSATTIDNDASDDIATRVRFNTRVQSRVMEREDRARLYKCEERARMEKVTRCSNLESA